MELTLLASFGQRLPRIGSLSSSKTDKLSTRVGESSVDEDGAEPLKAVAERTGIMPEAGTNVASVIRWNTTNVDNNPKDDKANDCNDLDHPKDKLDLSIPPHTKKLDGDEENKEDGDPNGWMYIVTPEVDREAGSD